MGKNNINDIWLQFPTGDEKNVQRGISLLELSKEYQKNYKYTIIAAKFNNEIKELNFCPSESGKVEFLDLSDNDGMRIYRRSATFVLIKAVNDLFPDRSVVISHSISKGLYCDVKGDTELTQEEVEKLELRMKELVKAKIPFIKREVALEEAKEFLINSGRVDRYHAIEHRNKRTVTIYNCEGKDDYFYGYMAPDTDYVERFMLRYYSSGLIMVFPEISRPDTLPDFFEQKKLFKIFIEYKRWGHILGVDNIGELNDIIKSGDICDLMRVSEALHEKKIAQIADLINSSEHRKRIVLISGPSSSGKTTFAHRLAIQLRVNGLKPTTISLDNYFVNREKTPLDENGELDFEAFEAIDVKLFNDNLTDLIRGKEVEMPIFNFQNGRREATGKKMKIDGDQILVIEGIHGLNEKLTESIPRENKFKIYVSAITSMNIDDHNRIPTTDTRIIRRIVRDYQFRACSALSTMKRWSSVRRGEEKNIFPFQEEADIMFNSSLIFELSVLKQFAEPLLNEIDNTHQEYSEARRLIEFLSYFLPIDSKEVPGNSLLREFIGGSNFY